MILVIGPSGAGKTLLLKQLEEINSSSKSTNSKERKEGNEPRNISHKSLRREENSREIIPATIPTIGCNVCKVNMNKKQLTVQEVGGSMQPLWKTYYKDARKIAFVINIADPTQIASSKIQLLQMLTSEDLKDTPVLLLLNKSDLFCAVSHSEMKSMLGIDNIIAHASQQIKVIESSVKYGTGLQEVIEWLT